MKAKLVKESLVNSIKEGFFFSDDVEKLTNEYGKEIEDLTNIKINLKIYPGNGVIILFDNKVVLKTRSKEPKITAASYLGGVLEGIKLSESNNDVDLIK
jgi:hypothetical protein